jgi:hypothetical protein
LAQKNRAAGSCSGDRQVLWGLVRQEEAPTAR